MNRKRLEKLKELGEDVTEDLFRLQEREGSNPLRALLNSVEPGDIWIHGAYMSHRKTTLAVNAMRYWENQGLEVRIIAPEGIPTRLIHLINPHLRIELTQLDRLATEEIDIDVLIIDQLLLLAPPGAFVVPALKQIAQAQNIVILGTTVFSRDAFMGNRPPYSNTDVFRPTEARFADILTAGWTFIGEPHLHISFLRTKWDFLPPQYSGEIREDQSLYLGIQNG
ncbi:MAG: hypothetical protein GF334_00805 [Candidatus Altiarchaeales archaeon]|nr:hypothetical protein [Candidatus Altiarchaeales archaeon]